MSAKPPSAFQIEAALSRLNRVREAFAREEIHDDEMLDQITGATRDATEILGGLLRGAVHYSDLAIVAAQRAAAIGLRKDRFLAREQILRDEAAQLAAELGIRKHDYGDLAFSTAPGKESVVITNLEKLPAALKKVDVKVTPDKKAILEELKNGVVVEGAELRNPQSYIVIRTR
jgi:hypothetical protein